MNHGKLRVLLYSIINEWGKLSSLPHHYYKGEIT
jgi:hypothetical protein